MTTQFTMGQGGKGGGNDGVTPKVQIMVDVEAVDTRPTAGLLQIGAVHFSTEVGQPAKLMGEFSCCIALQSSLLAGGTIDQDTLKWWRRQSEVARNAVERETVTLPEGLLRFAHWLALAGFEPESRQSVLWCRGTSYDQVVLEHGYASVGLEAPWKFFQWRCARTTIRLARDTGYQSPARESEAHEALADARYQAIDLAAALNHIHYNGVWHG